jgi:hypothetical protein
MAKPRHSATIGAAHAPLRGGLPVPRRDAHDGQGSSTSEQHTRRGPMAMGEHAVAGGTAPVGRRRSRMVQCRAKSNQELSRDAGAGWPAPYDRQGERDVFRIRRAEQRRRQRGLLGSARRCLLGGEQGPIGFSISMHESLAAQSINSLLSGSPMRMPELVRDWLIRCGCAIFNRSAGDRVAVSPLGQTGRTPCGEKMGRHGCRCVDGDWSLGRSTGLLPAPPGAGLARSTHMFDGHELEVGRAVVA